MSATDQLGVQRPWQGHLDSAEHAIVLLNARRGAFPPLHSQEPSMREHLGAPFQPRARHGLCTKHERLRTAWDTCHGQTTFLLQFSSRHPAPSPSKPTSRLQPDGTADVLCTCGHALCPGDPHCGSLTPCLLLPPAHLPSTTATGPRRSGPALLPAYLLPCLHSQCGETAGQGSSCLSFGGHTVGLRANWMAGGRGRGGAPGSADVGLREMTLPGAPHRATHT